MQVYIYTQQSIHHLPTGQNAASLSTVTISPWETSQERHRNLLVLLYAKDWRVLPHPPVRYNQG